MRRSVATRLTLGAALAATATLLLPGCSASTKPADTAPPSSADTARNFGFPLGFSPSTMDLRAAKANEGAMRQILPVDPHPPGVYRMAAPSQHEQAFYEAFGIRAGDRMWLDPKDRVRI